MNKPKELWINYYETEYQSWDATVTTLPPAERVPKDMWIDMEDSLHVVEYSAYKDTLNRIRILENIIKDAVLHAETDGWNNGWIDVARKILNDK